MKILIDIGHPAHVHFFAEPIRLWQEKGCQIIVTSRRKEIAVDLLDALNVPHRILSSQKSGSVSSLACELLQRNKKLLKVIKEEKPDVMTGIGGVFIAQTGFLTRVPSIVFYDTENATLSNLITYPVCSLAAVPACYQGWLPPWNLRYPGYHELSYLHPNRFQPSRDIALQAGLDPVRPTFLIRTVSWQASHDILAKGWNAPLLREVTRFLQTHGKVLISAEGELPDDLVAHQYQGAPEDIHHLMGHLSLFIGESATMASECAVLGIPAIYAAETGRGYTDEQENRYGLVRNIRNLDWSTLRPALEEIIATPQELWQERRQQLLQDTIDVAPFVAELVQNYPESLHHYRKLFHTEES